MRQFRGLTKDTKRWAYGWYCEIEGRHWIVLDDAEVDCIGASTIEVIPESVGQSIIVEGKEFYEGDVAKNDTGDIGVVRFGKLPLGKSGDCVCTYPAFYIHWFGQLGQAPTYECSEIGEWMEIIGTIHTTHPELLEIK